MPKGKPRYSTIVRSLEKMVQYVDGHILGPMDAREIKDTYAELNRESIRARKLVERAKE